MADKKLIPIELGDTKKIGEKEYELTEEGGLKMQVAVPLVKTYNMGGLLAKKAQLEAELAEIESLLAKHAELMQVQP
jgi:hypothetical protein